MTEAAPPVTLTPAEQQAHVLRRALEFEPELAFADLRVRAVAERFEAQRRKLLALPGVDLLAARILVLRHAHGRPVQEERAPAVQRVEGRRAHAVRGDVGVLE